MAHRIPFAMRFFFWFALVVGGGMILLSLLSDFLDVEVDDFGSGSHAGDVARILSLRNLTYFLFGFGAVGVGLDWIWNGERPLLAASVAAGVGAVSALIATLAFGWIRRNEAGERESEDTFIGLRGRITLPIGADHAGRVVVRRGERDIELRARPFDADASNHGDWYEVVVVEMCDGTALVTPIELPPG